MMLLFFGRLIATVCDLYGEVRERWKYMSSKNYFRLKYEVKEVSPKYVNLQLDDWNINFYDQSISMIIVTFPTVEGTIG